MSPTASSTVTATMSAGSEGSPQVLPPEGSKLGWAVKDGIAMTARNLLTMVRVPEVLVFSLVQPVIFTLMFRYVFGGAISIPGQNYVDYLMPGIFVQTLAFGAVSTAVGLAEDKGKGLLERLRSLPMSRSAVLAGRVMADSVRNVLIVSLLVGIGFVVGFRTHTNVPMVLLSIALMVLFGFSLAWIFSLMGLSVANGEAAQAASFPLLAPLVFASNLFVDPRTMPSWLRGWARHQPVSATADAVRACMLGGPTAHKVLVCIIWSFVIVAVVAPIAVLRYRKA